MRGNRNPGDHLIGEGGQAVPAAGRRGCAASHVWEAPLERVQIDDHRVADAAASPLPPGPAPRESASGHPEPRTPRDPLAYPTEEPGGRQAHPQTKRRVWMVAAAWNWQGCAQRWPVAWAHSSRSKESTLRSLSAAVLPAFRPPYIPSIFSPTRRHTRILFLVKGFEQCVIQTSKRNLHTAINLAICDISVSGAHHVVLRCRALLRRPYTDVSPGPREWQNCCVA